jgi:hypothetical protein
MISISVAYFSAVKAKVDFFNRIGQKRTLTTGLHGSNQELFEANVVAHLHS